MIIHLESWLVPVCMAHVKVDKGIRAFVMLMLLWHFILAFFIHFLMIWAKNCVNKWNRVRNGSLHNLNVIGIVIVFQFSSDYSVGIKQGIFLD